MKTYVLIYKEFAHFEVILASYFLKTVGEIITVGLSKEPVVSAEGYKIIPDMTIEEVNAKDADAFMIPGGDPSILEGQEALYTLIREMNAVDAIMGGICSGTLQFAKAGILADKEYTTSLEVGKYEAFDEDMFVNENVVLDDNIVTAKASGYVDFGIMMGHMMDIFQNEEDLEETVEFFREFKS